MKGLTFEIGKGVRQGDPLSSNRKLKWEEMEKRIKTDGKYLSNVRFADEEILIGKTKEELQEMFHSFVEVSREARLECNTGKTKVLSNTSGIRIKLGNDDIVEIKEYKYLGKIVSLEGSMEKEPKDRRKAAWKSY